MQIGTFTRTRHGYAGRIQTLTLDAPLTLVPVASRDGENAPDWRVHLGDDESGPEVGAGWNENGERAGNYVSLRLDDPTFVQPIRAALFQTGDDASAWSLRWNRPQKRREQD
jgi:uncharacterized protein (DUF736 family)